MTEQDIRRKLLYEMERNRRTQKDQAALMQVSPQYFSDFMTAKRGVGSRILAYLGIERQVSYRASK